VNRHQRRSNRFTAFPAGPWQRPCVILRRAAVTRRPWWKRCVIGENGESDKLIGDGIMTLFNDPDACLRAAVSMCRELRTFNGSGAFSGDRALSNVSDMFAISPDTSAFL